MQRVVVTGGAGFIGGHLCRYLKEKGYWVLAVDKVHPRYGEVVCDDWHWGCDLRDPDYALWATECIDEVYALAATMGGAGIVFSGSYDREILNDNATINLNTMRAAWQNGVKRYLYTSSACTYNQFKQNSIADLVALKESDAYPAWPDSEYGWEKLFSERLALTYGRLTDMEVRIARLHNVYGPHGAWNDGHEKLPAAACRKAAEAKVSGNHTVEVWGDGEQQRSFCYITDATELLWRLMNSECREPVNVGTDELVSVNQAYDLAAQIAGIEIEKRHDLTKPTGVRARNADLTFMIEQLGYTPQVSLAEGLRHTYQWIEQQVMTSAGQS